MILIKKGNSQKNLVFINRHRDWIYLNIAVRDVILPKEYVFIDYDGKNKIVLIPTNDSAGYKVSLKADGEASIGYCAQKKVLALPLNKRIYGKIEDNGTISFNLAEQ